MATPRRYKFGDMVAWADPSEIRPPTDATLIIAHEDMQTVTVFYLQAHIGEGQTQHGWDIDTFVPMPNKNRTL